MDNKALRAVGNKLQMSLLPPTLAAHHNVSVKISTKKTKARIIIKIFLAIIII